MYTNKLLLALACAVAVGGCGDATDPCPISDGETHLSGGPSEPDGLYTMLHHVDRACAVVGENRLHLYAQDEPYTMHAAAGAATGLVPAHGAEEHAPVIVSVTATMPAHGHGTAVAPIIDAADPSQFTVALQMPGTWHLVVEFTLADVTTTTQSGSYEIEVQ